MTPTIDNDIDRLTELRADLATATRLVPTTWPLSSFVAANPLQAFENLPFERACHAARQWFGASTHQPVAWYRDRAARGEIGLDALRQTVLTCDPLLEHAASFEGVAGPVDALDVVVDDLLHGPLPDEPEARSLDPWCLGAVDHVSAWCAAYTDPHPSRWSMPDRDRGFFTAWRLAAVHDRRLRALVGIDGVRFITELPDNPVDAIATAVSALGIPPEERVDALRSLLLTLPGWCGLARWVDEWAPPGGLQIDLHVSDIVAVLAAVDAAGGRRRLTLPRGPVTHERDDRHLLAARADAAASRLGITAPAAGGLIHELLSRETLPDRAHIWLIADELQHADAVLGALDRPDAGPRAGRPAAQLVACIDVRSEVLRRHLEAVGDYETFGFAGFFGFPIAWRAANAPVVEPRCPALVQPRHEVEEIVVEPDEHRNAQQRRRGLLGAHRSTKADLGAPFAFAESMGWFHGVNAALRTLVPGLLTRRRQGDPAPSHLAIDAELAPRGGLTHQERVLYAEAVVTTIGMHRFAPLVVLCGHASSTVNNPHASALDCGACGGAPGGVNARVAAAALNDPSVRADLASRDVRIPDDTWFLAAEHNTTTDEIELFDIGLVPAARVSDVERLQADLRLASRQTAAEREQRLPGTRAPRLRSADWAEVRPEWGLAGNAAFVVGPRSITAGLDLSAEVFLHSYDATSDDDGTALETIMTAPLVVAQWISSQYYFSTVDPEAFGAGDKMIHNIVGGFGVLRGESGDLAVGLPWQSVGVGDRVEHTPLRLLAAIQAPRDRIDRIIERNPVVRDLVDNEWIRLAARADGDEPWAIRRPGGTWTTWSAATDRPTRQTVGTVTPTSSHLEPV